MRIKFFSLLAILLGFSPLLSAQQTVLYTHTFLSPYSSSPTTLTIKGPRETKVREYINYLFYGNAEVNVLEVQGSGPLSIEVTLTGDTVLSTQRELYQNLTGLMVSDIPDQQYNRTVKVELSGALMELNGGTQTETGTLSWDPGSDAVAHGVIHLGFGVKEMLTFDQNNQGNLITGFGPASADKLIHLRWVRDSEDILNLGPISQSGNELTVLVTLPATRGMAPWRSINLWEDGLPQDPSRLRIQMENKIPGWIEARLFWPLQPGRTYQVQVVDPWGQSTSVLFPNTQSQL